MAVAVLFAATTACNAEGDRPPTSGDTGAFTGHASTAAGGEPGTSGAAIDTRGGGGRLPADTATPTTAPGAATRGATDPGLFGADTDDDDASSDGVDLR